MRKRDGKNDTVGEKRRDVTRVARKIEKDCHARRSGGDKVGGMGWSGGAKREREKVRTGETAG